MKSVNLGAKGIQGYGDQVVISLGSVKNNADPAQHGRLQIFIPSVDTKDFEVEDLPWAIYVSPFGGSTADLPVGREDSLVPGVSSYGIWAIPKNGAQVLCGFLEGDPNVRFWMGCFFMPELNRTLPQSVNDIKTEIDESGLYPQTTIPHYKKNLGEAGLGPTDAHWKTRGGWQRSVSHPSNKNKNKPTDDGYFTKPLEPEKADSQIYSWTTPGRHYIAMSDVANECRVRIKTTEGTQIILDDTNERIYISTAMGRNWIEIDEGSGKIYFYTASKFNLHSENDINLYSKENINIVAKKRVNIKSEERAVKIQGKMNLELLSTDANIKITASRDLHIKTTDGPRASSVNESLKCSLPPYTGEPLGLIRDWAEEQGSNTSKIYINSVMDVNIRSDKESIFMTTLKNIHARTLEGDVMWHSARNSLFKSDQQFKINSQGSLDLVSDSDSINSTAPDSINLVASALRTSVGSTSFLDGESQTVTSIGNGSAASSVSERTTIAPPAIAVFVEDIKPNMIIPEHDFANGWVRDNDESQCKTPRNKNYQG